MTRRATFRVDAIPLSLNEWSRRRPAYIARLKADYATEVWAAVLAARQHGTWDGQRFHQAECVVRYHFPDGQRRDPDNYTPKFLLDALVAAGVLTDDDFTHLDLRIQRGADARPPWVEVVVEEMSSDGG